MKKLENRMKYISWVMYGKLLFVILSLFSAFSHPHIIRQLDTLGITARYWLRWTIEPVLNHPFFPALIQAGDAYGIHATEFPLLYILLAPIFSLPNPYNIFVARILFFALNLVLTYISFKIWKKNGDKETNFKAVHIFLMIFGISSVYVGRFMPDYPSFILVLIAMALSYKKINYLSLPIAALGLLLKPTAIITFGFYLLKDKKELLGHIIKWIFPSVLIALIYYVWGTNYLNSISDIPRYFYSNFRNPIEQLLNFFISYKNIPKLFFKDLFSSYLLIFIIWDLFKSKFKLFKLWAVLILQILAGAALDGSHSFIHDYYFIGTSFIVAIIFYDFLMRQSNKIFFICLTILSLFTLEKGFHANKQTFSQDNKLWQCAKIKNEILKIDNTVYKIRNSPDHRADLGTCLTLKQNSNSAEFGVYYKNNVPLDGTVIFQTKDLILKRF